MNYAELMKKKNSYAIILVVGTAVVSLLIAGLGIYPLYKSAVAVTKEADQKSAELKGLKDRKSILDGLKSREDELKKNAEIVASALPDGKDIGGLFIQINALVAKSSGTVSSISGGNTASAQAVGSGFGGIQKYTYSIPVSFSSYFTFKEFVSSSKNALRLLNINDITLSSGKDGRMESLLNITTYGRI